MAQFVLESPSVRGILSTQMVPAKAAEIAYIALGSNLGDSTDIIQDAYGHLQTFSEAPLIKSSLWRTTPVDCPPGSPLFVNTVVALVPRQDETPRTLLRKLRAIEKKFGRLRRRITNEPRTIDLDLIAFGSRTADSDVLTIPHPRAHLRRFVLQPLDEIAPDLILPGQTKTVRQLLRGLKSDEKLKRL
jgi:2-amino-4-hydroxy-6-hydroxymethyldihydropteridine diphosphokinase